MRLSIVIGILNQHDITKSTIRKLATYADDPQEIQLILIDNGSNPAFNPDDDIDITLRLFGQVTIHHNKVNEGCYPGMFKQGLELANSPVVAFIHSDLFIVHGGYDTAILAQFDNNQNLGLMGVIGSTEIDGFGGRGMGTHSNFQGGTYPKKAGYDQKRCRNCNEFEADHMVGSAKLPNGEQCTVMDSWGDEAWTGSPAEVHGKRDEGFIIDGAVIDGCVMIFRKSILETIGFKENYPLHHFYDRAMSVQVREAGYKVGILGLKVDHISGQTANHENSYHEQAKQWAFEKWGITEPHQWYTLEENKNWVINSQNPSKGNVPNGWDHVIYLTAEKLFLEEYRDQKHIIPINC